MSHKKGFNMWLENLKEARIKAGNPSNKVIAEKAHCSEKTVSRIFNGKMEFPDTCTIEGIAVALGTTLGHILAGTDTSVGDVTVLEEQIASLTAEVVRLTNKVDYLELTLTHKEEIIKLKDEIIDMYQKSVD